MDKAELAKQHPDLLAEIQREADDAALATQAQQADTAAQAAVDRTLQLLATVCGQETADKVSALVKSGMTPEQLAAAAKALNVGAAAPDAPEKSPEAAKGLSEEMLAAIKAATPSAVNANPADPDGVLATIHRIGNM